VQKNTGEDTVLQAFSIAFALLLEQDAGKYQVTGVDLEP
jgi:hypothetical protein